MLLVEEATNKNGEDDTKNSTVDTSANQELTLNSPNEIIQEKELQFDTEITTEPVVLETDADKTDKEVTV